MAPIIRVQNVGKKFRLGARGPAYATLRETLAGAARAPLGWLRRRGEGAEAPGASVWAVEDVSFEVAWGETVGIIGRNGAGKSTLLKLLSRIIEPTRGRIELFGRVGSLLEVGTGFHPELTGRENVFLNGAILGMSRGDIVRKFDEIVSFAEVEQFLDTPVKHYSSGMYMRLAFAVAAHLDPEILIIDEVLAVGDSSFQRKCLEKMQKISQQGSTVLFVSHNMQAVARLCARSIMISQGRVIEDGPSHRVISSYLGGTAELASVREWPDPERAPGDEWVRLRAVRLRAGGAPAADLVDIRKPVAVEIEYDVLRPGNRLSGCIVCNNEDNICIFSSADLSADSLERQDVSYAGRRVTTCVIPGNFLAEGMFSITVNVFSVLGEIQLHATASDAVQFRVVDPIEGDSARGVYAGPVAGVVRPFLAWETEAV